MPHDFGTVLKLAALVLSLGLDTLTVAVALGIRGIGTRGRIRVGVSFAFFEGSMPLAGLLVGRAVSGAVGNAASIIGIAVLFGVGLWMVYESVWGEEDTELDVEHWRGLLLTSLSISLDEVAIGFSMGALGVPIPLTIGLIVIQTFVMTFIGTSLGNRIGERLAERGETVAGIVLCSLALALAGSKVIGMR